MIEWWGPILVEYYSSTEGNGITVIDSQEWLDHPGSVGRAMLGVARVCDEDGNELPAGRDRHRVLRAGAATVRLPQRPGARPLKRPTRSTPTWTTTGDIGYLDEDGFLFLTDRKAFMIISGGVNIYPQEIEDVLALHPKVADVAVIGVPDPEMGEEVKAVVQPVGRCGAR